MASVSEALDHAIRLHQSGELQQAAQIYQQILAVQPDNPNALQLLGTLAYQTGDYPQAIRLLSRAAELVPGSAAIHNNLGLAQGKSDDQQQAEASFRRALEFEPNSFEGHNNLANSLRDQGKLDAAIDAYGNAIRLNPGYAEAHNNLAVALQDAGRPQQAEASFHRAIQLNPNYADAHANLGTLLKDIGRLDEAAASFNAALRIKPNDPALYSRFASLFTERKHYARAIVCLEKAIALSPADADYRYQLGSTLRNCGRLDEAMQCFEEALRLAPDSVDAAAAIASVLELQGDVNAACERLSRLLDAHSDNINVLTTFATVSERLDRADEAIAHLETYLSGENRLRSDRILAHFALGNLYDQAHRYDEAFAQFDQANGLKAVTFDVAHNAEQVRQMIEVFAAGHEDRLPRAGNRSEVPVFIVGMPRSGTSLVEQILASHADVYGLGESPEIQLIAAKLPAEIGVETPFPACMTAATQIAIDKLADSHLARLAETSGNAARVTDKLPDNFWRLGLIAHLFPAARVIHCQRDPRDTCLSCYVQNFTGHHPYTYRVDDLGTYYRDYERLMRHWRGHLGLPMLEVRYEDLVSRSEETVRQMIEFCGLPWDERCLRFYESDRISLTASYDQVRRPIYTSSVGRWRNYERHLGPLLEQLGDA